MRLELPFATTQLCRKGRAAAGDDDVTGLGEAVKHVAEWAKIPTREQLLQSRLLRPFAHHLRSPLIWRFNRRGVARGASLGLFAAFAIPVAQTPFAALFAVASRANLPVAALATLVTNPFTVPFVYYLAFLTGKAVLQLKEDATVSFGSEGGMVESVLRWLVTAAGPTYLGLLIFAGITSSIGFFAVHIGWRFWVGQRWKRRCRHRAERDRNQRLEAGA